MRQSRDRINILKLALGEKTEKQVANSTKLTELLTKNDKLSKNLPKYEERVEKLRIYIARKQEELQKSREELLTLQPELKQLTKARIEQLMHYIFPITIVQPKRWVRDKILAFTPLGSFVSYSQIESAESDMVSALAEATHTTYIRDKWVYTDNSGELQHCIVAPSLPGSGNYSAYNVWGKSKCHCLYRRHQNCYFSCPEQRCCAWKQQYRDGGAQFCLQHQRGTDLHCPIG